VAFFTSYAEDTTALEKVVTNDVALLRDAPFKSDFCVGELPTSKFYKNRSR
jgi:hypothetical protein